MLTNVPDAINRMVRNVVLNHANSNLVQVIRKVITRDSDSNLMGLPTIGGLGVLSSDDEENVEFEPLGNAYVLRVGGFNSSIMMDRQDANNGSEDIFLYLIEPEILINEVGGFEIKKNDVFYYGLQGTAKLAFEIVAIETTSNIPPYTQRYICNRRDDLHL